MAGYGLNDLRVAASHEEPGLKQTIAFAWEAMKRTNWDDTKFCTINPILMMSYSMAKSFQGFYNNEGWDVVIKRKDRNYCFDIYRVD